MDNVGGNRLDGLSNAVRKKRSQTSRRPRPDSQAFIETNDPSPFSSNSPSDDRSKVSSDENACFDANSKRKEFNLNQGVSQSFLGSETEGSQKKINKDGGYSTMYNGDHVRIGSQYQSGSEGVLAPANWKSCSSSKLEDSLDSESRSVELYGGRNGETLNSGQSGVIQDGMGNENRVKKVKLKVGGVTRTIQANSSSIGATPCGLSTKSSRYDSAQPRDKQNFQGTSGNYHSPSDKRNGLQGIPWKDFSNGGFSLGKEDSSMGRMPGKNTSGKQGDKSESVRKSKRAPKKRVLDDDFGDDDDDEIRYLEKLKTSKVSTVYKEDDEESSKKHLKLSSISSSDNVPLKLGKDVKKKPRSDRLYEDVDYVEEEESGSDVEVDGKKKQKQKRESIDSLMDSKREMTLTMRQRALQSKDSSAAGASLIEFPNGLPPAPPRKQKEKLSEVEQQLKKAEAAQRRRMQVEKAARESEAEAIRKILGQESSRKKREEKIKKHQEELAQKKAANAMILAPNSVRVVMGPNGTVVTFSEDMGLPSIFDSKPCSYPPPRENCAGPSCKNPYKYRDSKSKLPLCSLQCYKAIQEKMVAEA